MAVFRGEQKKSLETPEKVRFPGETGFRHLSAAAKAVASAARGSVFRNLFLPAPTAGYSVFCSQLSGEYQ
jgi:hypothetical protein